MPIRNIAFSGVYPLLPVKIVNPFSGQALSVKAIVDTGASSCAFLGDFAALLGLDLKKGIPGKTNSAGGTADSYSHTTTIEIYDFQGRLLYTLDKIVVEFMPGLAVPLLGVRDFLGKFNLHIDYPNKKFCKRSRVQNAVLIAA